MKDALSGASFILKLVRIAVYFSIFWSCSGSLVVI